VLSAVAAMGTVGLSVFGAAGSAQASTDTQWHLVYRGHSAGLQDAVAISKTNAWAVGTIGGNTPTGPQFMHWNGKAWSVYNIHNITKYQPIAIGASAANNVWAFGENETANPQEYALIFNGSTWTSKLLPEGFMTGEEAVLGPASVWAVTNQPCTITGQSACTVVVHWNGSGRSSATVPGKVLAVDSVGGHAFFYALTDMKFAFNSGSGFGVAFHAVAPIPGSASAWGVGGRGSGNQSPWTTTLVAVNGPLP
jgi:hypothetical protein